MYVSGWADRATGSFGAFHCAEKKLSFGASHAVYMVKYREKTYHNLSL